MCDSPKTDFPQISRALDPLVFGEYPEEMRHFLDSELPRFTLEEAELVKDSTDFLGINHYGTLYAQDCLYTNCVCPDFRCSKAADHPILGFVYTTPLRDGIPIGEPVREFLRRPFKKFYLFIFAIHLGW